MMKERPIKLMNLKDLIRFQAYVYTNHLHGEIRQMKYVSNIRSGLWLALALPLDDATLYMEERPELNESDLARICHVVV